MDSLPDDILVEILNELSFEDFMKIRRTCKRFNIFDKYIECKMEKYMLFYDGLLKLNLTSSLIMINF
jgi:hypothetical protein